MNIPVGFEFITEVQVPRSGVETGQNFLRAAGKQGKEGMVLWAGIAHEDVFRVTQVIVPQQRGIRTEDGVCVIVDPPELHSINVNLYQAGIRLIAQVHSHPGHAYHSEMDDTYALATTVGSFSLVVPDFACREFSFSDCAVYRLNRNGNWKEVPPQKIKQTLHLVDG